MKRKRFIRQSLERTNLLKAIQAVRNRSCEKYARNFMLNLIEEKLIKDSQGVLHIGAHLGQESSLYSRLRKPVLWIEADPSRFELLRLKISEENQQKAICALLGKEKKEKVNFYIASNNGASSSVYDFGREVGFRNLRMNAAVQLSQHRLDEILDSKVLAQYDHWVVDVQGSELDVLLGSGSLINLCHSMRIECSTREVYAGGAKWKELHEFLVSKGFRNLWDPGEQSHEDVLYIR